MRFCVLLVAGILLSGCKTVDLSDAEKHYLLKDSGQTKFYLVNLIRKNQKAGFLGNAPLLMIDDAIIYNTSPEITQEITISKSEIRKIEIMEPKKSIKLFGASGKYGYLHILTYGNQVPLP